MSSEANPINPARFAEALKELPASRLALEVFELRNSIAHLDYSNAEMKPFAEGSASTLDSTGASEPDQVCIDAIAENEAVIARKQQRMRLIKIEVESRGMNWAEFQGKEGEEEEENRETNGAGSGQVEDRGSTRQVPNGVNGHANENGQQQQHPAWQDGTFQTGTLALQGLEDEGLTRRLQERVPELQHSDGEQDEADGGLHL